MWVLIVLLDKAVNHCDKFFDAAEGSPANGLLGNDVEPNLDLVEPRSIGWRVMDLIARMHCQPSFHGWMLMCGVVIHNEMDIKLRRDIGINLF